jgi:DnaJ-class molecular chaperone
MHLTSDIYYAPEICAICNGFGKYKGAFLTTKCPACGGSGSILVAQPAHK